MITTEIKTTFIDFSDFLKLCLLSCLLVLELLPWLAAKLFLSEIFNIPIKGIYEMLFFGFIINLLYNVYICHSVFKSFSPNSELKKEFSSRFLLPPPTVVLGIGSLAGATEIDFIFWVLYMVLIFIVVMNYRKILVKNLYFLMPSFSGRAK